MERIYISELYRVPGDYAGREITVGGWARTIRDMKSFGFMELNDGSCFKGLQVVFEDGVVEDYKGVTKQNVGASFVVRGTFTLTPDAKQPFELKASSIQLEGASAPEYPLQKKRHSVEYLRTVAHLRPRTNLFSAVFRIRSVAAFAIHSFFQDRGFVYVNTPLITGSDCEGAGEMFRVTTLDPKDPPLTEDGEVDWSQDFFGKMTSLTVSGQLNGETYAMAFGNIYTFGPTRLAGRRLPPMRRNGTGLGNPGDHAAIREAGRRLSAGTICYRRRRLCQSRYDWPGRLELVYRRGRVVPAGKRGRAAGR